MNITEIHEHAQKLYAAHRDRAEFEAAQHARKCQESGNEQEAEDWRRIRSAIRQLRGPNES